MLKSVGWTSALVGGVVSAVLAIGGAAQAATIANGDQVARTITLMEDGSSRQVTIAAGNRIERVCSDGCIVRVDGDPERDFVLEGSERVTIEGGLIYYDGEVREQDRAGGEAGAEPRR